MKRNLKSVKQMVESGPFTEGGYRWQIANSARNGMDAHGVLFRVGARVLIDVDAYDRWLESQQSNPQTKAAAA